MFLNNTPILDGTYIYNKINKKLEDNKEINIYEQFYLWSYHNRNKVLFWLFILLIISLLSNGFINNKNKKLNIHTQSGGKDDNEKDNNEKDDKKNDKKNDSGYKYLSKNISFRSTKSRAEAGNLSRYEQIRLADRSLFTRATNSYIFFPLIDKFFLKIWGIMFSSKMQYIIAVTLIIYGFGIIIIPLIILFLIVKYTLKAVNKTFIPYKEYKIEKKIRKKNKNKK
jgi:hypothetical protein